MLFYYLHKVKGEQGKVCRTIVTTHMLDVMAQKWGVELVRIPRIGFKWIGDLMNDEGESFVLAGEESLVENPVFIEWNHQDGHPLPGEAEVNREMRTPWRSVISPDRWKLNLSALDQCELYDLNSDPAELTNLYDDPEQQERVKAMTELIVQWQEEVGDSAPLP